MVTAQVRDFAVALAWYRDVLGLALLYQEPGEFAMLAPPGTDAPALALATDHPERIPAAPPSGWMPVLAVADFDGAVAQLRERGVRFDAEEEGADEGYRLVRILDPDGNPIGIAAG